MTTVTQWSRDHLQSYKSTFKFLSGEIIPTLKTFLSFFDYMFPISQNDLLWIPLFTFKMNITNDYFNFTCLIMQQSEIFSISNIKNVQKELTEAKFLSRLTIISSNAAGLFKGHVFFWLLFPRKAITSVVLE